MNEKVLRANQQTRVILKDGKRKKFYSKKANARSFTAIKQTQGVLQQIQGVLGQTSEGTQWV